MFVILFWLLGNAQLLFINHLFSNFRYMRIHTNTYSIFFVFCDLWEIISNIFKETMENLWENIGNSW